MIGYGEIGDFHSCTLLLNLVSRRNWKNIAILC